MRKSLLLLGVAGLVTACGQSNDNPQANQAAAQPKKKPPYCFFKDEEMKDWAATRNKDGNITVKGKAHVKDPRYKAVLGAPSVSGTSAELSPGISQNDTGYGAPDDTWDVAATIQNSATITSILVTCGGKTAAKLEVPPKG
jgi:hypothetical protein